MHVATLDTLDRGAKGEILAIADRCERSACLRRMGLREGAIVEIMSSHDPVILKIDGSSGSGGTGGTGGSGGSRIAVGREMLREVTICRCGCDKEDSKSRADAARVRPRVERRRGMSEAKRGADTRSA